MTPVEEYLYKTRNSVLDACNALRIKTPYEQDIELAACSSCSIWLKPIQMKQDLDGYPICENCLAHYGP
jgi:hypothetical protein